MQSKKILLFISISLFGLVGCADKNSLLKEKHNSYKEEQFIPYYNDKHIIGVKENSIKTLSYIKTINNKVDMNITFYIDKTPYTKSFNLCEDMEDNKILSTVETINGIDKLIFKDEPIDCNSWINIDLDFENKLIGAYSIKLLKGFRVGKLKGYDVFLSETDKHSISYTDFTDRTSHYSLRKTGELNEKTFWIMN